MEILYKPKSFLEIWDARQVDLGDIIKIVVDVHLQIIGVDVSMHADAEELMLDQGSEQKDLWGANLLISKIGYEIEYTSFINIRPGQGNRSMEIQDQHLRDKIQKIITDLIK